VLKNEQKPLRLRDQLIRSFVGIGVLRAMSMPISLVVSIILARGLGPEMLGQYAFVIALIPLLALPAAGGLPDLLTREVAKFAHARTWGAYRGIQRFGYGWVFGYSAIIVAIVWLAFVPSGAAGLDGKWHLLPIAVLLVPLMGLIGINKGITKGLGHVALSEVPAMFIRPATFLAAVALLALGGKLTAATAVAGAVAAAAVAGIGGTLLLSRRRPAVAREAPAAVSAKKWSRALLPFSMIAVVGTLSSHIAILLLGLLDSDASVGVFQVASSGAGLVAVSLLLANMVIAPQVVRFRAERDTENLQLLSRQSARAAFGLAAPIALAYFVLGEDILRLVFGEAYAAAAFWPLVILAAGQLFNVYVGSVGILLSMSDHEMDTFRSQGVALVVNVVACAALIPAYGATGAALGSTIGLVTWNVLMAIDVKRRLGIRPTVL
jgi:O-antigen/teichoic acid export membrane protein